MSPRALSAIFSPPGKANGRREIVEELSRTHKDVPFGWLALLQEFLAQRAEARRRNADRRQDEAFPTLPNDLHNLAGPH